LAVDVRGAVCVTPGLTAFLGDQTVPARLGATSLPGRPDDPGRRDPLGDPLTEEVRA
jgi:hypothetical protein